MENVHIKESEKARESYVQYECKETKIMYPFVCQQKSVQFSRQPQRRLLAWLARDQSHQRRSKNDLLLLFSTSQMRGEQGMQAQEVQECENQPCWWVWAQACRKGMWSKRISGRKKGTGSKSNVAQG